jgi:hypothetical protein
MLGPLFGVTATIGLCTEPDFGKVPTHFKGHSGKLTLTAMSRRLDIVMPEFRETKQLLDEINTAILGYDPVLKEHARDILLREVFGLGKHGERSLNQTSSEPRHAESRKESAVPTLINYVEKWVPRTGVDRALLGLYYLKKVLGMESATGYQISKELRESGMRPANISVAMQENVKLQRALSRHKNGDKGTKRARNEYEITEVGIQYVESRFNLDYELGGTDSVGKTG